MRKIGILDCTTLVGHTPQSYEGCKTYVSTGAVDCDHIVFEDTEQVTYDERPSRANLSADVGDILFAKMASTEKTLRITEENSNFLYSTGFCAVRANHDVILDECLYYLLSSEQFLLQKDKNSSGATQKAVTNAGLAKITVSIPPIEEQRALAKKLDSITHLTALLKEEQKELDQLVKSRFVEMFGDPEYNTHNLPVVYLSDLCDIGSSKRVYQSEQSVTGVPFLRISDLGVLMDTGEIKADLYIPYNRFEELKSQGLVPETGDILVTSRGTIGRCYIVKDSDNFYFQDGMISWLSKFSNDVMPLYIAYLFNMAGFRKQIDDLQAGSTVAYLSIAMLKKLKIMLPPLDLQTQFASFVQAVDREKERVKGSLRELDVLKRALMQEYFG